MIIGKNLSDDSDFEVNLSIYRKTHTFIQAMTGGGKTSLILKKLEKSKQEDPELQNIFLDDQEEFTDIPIQYKDIKLISRDASPKIFSLGHARHIGIQTRRLGLSVVINLHDFEEMKDRAEFIAEFLNGFKSLGKEIGTPAKIYIDEADLYCPRVEKKYAIHSKEQIIDIAKRGRKLNITLVLATQSLYDVDASARKECANRIVGKTTELRDRNTVRDLMGLSKDQTDELFDFTAGNFYVRGDMFPKGVSRIYVPESNITRKQAGVAEESTKSTKSVDLDIFEDAVVNKNEQNLADIWKGKVVGLEKQLADLEKQLADQKAKTSQAFSEGFQASERNWKDKSKLERLLK